MAGKPPVASTTGPRREARAAARRDGLRPRPCERLVSARVSKRTPVVRGLPVARSITGAPSCSSQARSSSSRSNTSRWSFVAAGALARKSRTRGGARSPRSRAASSRRRGRPSRGRRRRRRARRLGRRDEPGHPGARDDQVGHGLDQREARLVLDVLELDAVGPHRNTASVFAASTTPATSSPRGAPPPRRVGAVHEHREVVEQRPLALVGVALAQHDPVVHRSRSPSRAKPSSARPVAVASGSGTRSTTWSRSVAAVGVLDEPERDALRGVQTTPAPFPCGANPAFASRSRTSSRLDAQHDPLEHATVPRALGGEQRQLALARVGADERERVGALDHVHPTTVVKRRASSSRSVVHRATWSNDVTSIPSLYPFAPGLRGLDKPFRSRGRPRSCRSARGRSAPRPRSQRPTGALRATPRPRPRPRQGTG